jgi:hypothetical protein
MAVLHSPGKFLMMAKEIFNPRFFVLLLIVLLAGLTRVLNAAEVMPWANFPVIGAIALFGSSYFNRWTSILVPLFTLLVSDITINLIIYNGKFGVMHGGWWWIYTIFLLIVLVDRLIMRKVTIRNFVIASVVSALMHWILSDTMLWINGSRDLRTMQPLSRDIDGLIQCYIQGIPFVRNYLTGTLAYGAIMFGVFEWIKKYKPGLVKSYVQSR